MKRLDTLVVSAASLALALGGCTDEPDNSDGDTAVVDGKGDGLTSFTLTLNTISSGLVRAKESPKLPGAPSGTTKFSCPIDDRTPEGWRLECTRGSEVLRLTYDPEGEVGAGIYIKSSSSPDRRSFYHCATTGAGTGGWPATLECTAKTPKTIISGQLVSPFSSSIEEVGILNSHLVATATTGAHVYRGMKPFRDSDIDDLKALDVGAVLIFKKPTGATEVADEVDALSAIGVPATQVANVEFPWKDFPDFAQPCRMTVQSLKLLQDWTAAGHNTFFHCTVGEDRTGYLAGLYRLLTDGSATVDGMFDQELCARGYSAGNPQKPFIAVVREVDTDLTPLFFKMAFKIRQGELTPTSLDESVCDTDPASDPAFTGTDWDPTAYRCKISPRYRL